MTPTETAHKILALGEKATANTRKLSSPIGIHTPETLSAYLDLVNDDRAKYLDFASTYASSLSTAYLELEKRHREAVEHLKNIVCTNGHNMGKSWSEYQIDTEDMEKAREFLEEQCKIK